MFVDFSHAGRDALDSAIPHAPANLVPILTSVRDHGLTFVMAAQSPRRFDVPQTGPAVVIIGDDLLRSLGPNGFHVKSLRRLMARVGAVSIMAGAPVASEYAKMTSEAVSRGIVVAIIETQVQHEEEWAAYLQGAAPSAEWYLVSPTVAGWQQ